MGVVKKSFKLTDKDFEFLKKYFLWLDKRSMHTSAKGGCTLFLTEEEQNSLITKLTDLLVEIGLDENDEPNDMGIQIERLIDVFNPYK